jgi:hypothetical protein
MLQPDRRRAERTVDLCGDGKLGTVSGRTILLGQDRTCLFDTLVSPMLSILRDCNPPAAYGLAIRIERMSE